MNYTQNNKNFKIYLRINKWKCSNMNRILNKISKLFLICKKQSMNIHKKNMKKKSRIIKKINRKCRFNWEVNKNLILYVHRILKKLIKIHWLSVWKIWINKILFNLYKKFKKKWAYIWFKNSTCCSTFKTFYKFLKKLLATYWLVWMCKINNKFQKNFSIILTSFLRTYKKIF